MGQVILSLEEYKELNKMVDSKQEMQNCFEIKKSYDDELKLNIEIKKAQQIFKELFKGSKFDDGTWEIIEKESDYHNDIVSYYIKAKKKENPEEVAELPIEKVEVEDEVNGN